jgi:hypothetical protein
LDIKANEAKEKYFEKNVRIVENTKRIKNWNNRTKREKEALRIVKKKSHTLRDFEYEMK